MPVSKCGWEKFLGIRLCRCQLRTLPKNWGRWSWGDYWCFLTSSLCCLNRPTVLLLTRPHSDNIRRTAAWMPGLKYLQACRVTFIDQPLRLRTWENDHDNNNNDKNDENYDENYNLVSFFLWVLHTAPDSSS